MFYSGQKQIFLLFFLRVFLRVFLMQLVTLDFCIYPEIKKIWRNRNSRYSWLVTTRISKAKYLRHSPLKWWRYFYYDGDCRIENCIWLQKSIFFKFCIFLWNSVKKRAYGIMNPYTQQQAHIDTLRIQGIWGGFILEVCAWMKTELIVVYWNEAMDFHCLFY